MQRSSFERIVQAWVIWVLYGIPTIFFAMVHFTGIQDIPPMILIWGALATAGGAFLRYSKS
jgi:hypothetical protein